MTRTSYSYFTKKFQKKTYNKSFDTPSCVKMEEGGEVEWPETIPSIVYESIKEPSLFELMSLT